MTKALSNQHTCTHTHTHATGNSTSSPSLFHLRPLSPGRAADAIAREAQRQQRLAARREATRQRADARRQLRREHQAAAAGALQQQVDEYLASIDPEKPLYQDGWAMGEMQEIFQQKLRSMRNLCCVVCSERWYTNGKWSDPTLCVYVLRCTRYARASASFFLLCKQALEPYPKTTCTRPTAGVQQYFVTCVTCVCPPTPHGRVLKCCFGRGGTGENKKGEYFFFKNKTKNAEGLELTSRGLLRAKRVINLRRWRKEHTQKSCAIADRGAITGQPYP